MSPADSTASPVFDFTEFEDVESAQVRIKNPKTGAPPAMVVTLAGPEHNSRKGILMARQRRIRAAVNRTGKMALPDPEEDDAEAIDLLVACTLGWEGGSLPYSPAAARSLYGDPKRRWLRDQVQAALDDRELFTRSSVVP